MTYSSPTLTSADHQWTLPTITSYIPWLSLAKLELKVAPAGGNRSVVAHAIKYGHAINGGGLGQAIWVNVLTCHMGQNQKLNDLLTCHGHCRVELLTILWLTCGHQSDEKDKARGSWASPDHSLPARDSWPHKVEPMQDFLFGHL